jgi:hypothetical protein
VVWFKEERAPYLTHRMLKELLAVPMTVAGRNYLGRVPKRRREDNRY